MLTIGNLAYSEMKMIAKPYAGEPQVRFDPGVQDSILWTILHRHETENGGIRPSLDLRNVAPVLYSTPTIGEPTVADAILDCLLHHSFKIELKGDSIRKIKK